MSTYQIPGAWRHTVVTTEHPASSYGLPVVLVGEHVYGPDDWFDGHPMGRQVRLVLAGQTKPMDEAVVDALCRWFSQSPEQGEEWASGLRELQRDLKAPYCTGDEP